MQHLLLYALYLYTTFLIFVIHISEAALITQSLPPPILKIKYNWLDSVHQYYTNNNTVL